MEKVYSFSGICKFPNSGDRFKQKLSKNHCSVMLFFSKLYFISFMDTICNYSHTMSFKLSKVNMIWQINEWTPENLIDLLTAKTKCSLL